MNKETIKAEIKRIIEIARLYKELKSLIPNYENEHLDAYEEIAERLNIEGGN